MAEVPMQKWIFRGAVLLVVPVLFAVGHSMVRPLPESFGKPSERKPAAERTIEEHEQDIAHLIEVFESGAALFIDARTRREYRGGHLMGAVHLPFEAFLSGRPPVLDMLPPEVPYMIYCGGGDCDASHNVREMLETFGYFEIEIFEPGWPAILDSGLPIVEGEGDWG